MRLLTTEDLILALHDVGRTPAEVATACEITQEKVLRTLEQHGKVANVWPPHAFDRVREIDQRG